MIAADEPSHGFDYSIALTVPPLGFLMLRPLGAHAPSTGAGTGATGALGAADGTVEDKKPSEEPIDEPDVDES